MTIRAMWRIGLPRPRTLRRSGSSGPRREMVARVPHPHLLRIEEHGIDALGTPWLITPFTGDVDGLRTLARLLREKGGQMEPLEVERTMEQVLRAVVEARSGGLSREDGGGAAGAWANPDGAGARQSAWRGVH